jgi:hypothetical protein
VDVTVIILAAVVGWLLMCLATARFCAMNTISDEHDRRVIDRAARELREDMRHW